ILFASSASISRDGLDKRSVARKRDLYHRRPSGPAHRPLGDVAITNATSETRIVLRYLPELRLACLLAVGIRGEEGLWPSVAIKWRHDDVHRAAAGGQCRRHRQAADVRP